MAQLVGLPCTICGERISTSFESAFCDKCGHPVHNGCRAPNASTPRTCPVCGTNLAIAERQAHEREKERREAEARRPPPPPLEFVRYVRYYQIARLFAGAGIAVMLGFFVISLDEPGATAAGIGAITAGLMLGVLGVFAARR